MNALSFHHGSNHDRISAEILLWKAPTQKQNGLWNNETNLSHYPEIPSPLQSL